MFLLSWSTSYVRQPAKPYLMDFNRLHKPEVPVLRQFRYNLVLMLLETLLFIILDRFRSVVQIEPIAIFPLFSLFILVCLSSVLGS